MSGPYYLDIAYPAIPFPSPPRQLLAYNLPPVFGSVQLCTISQINL